jgi:hypothetical protein
MFVGIVIYDAATSLFCGELIYIGDRNRCNHQNAEKNLVCLLFSKLT